MESFDHTIRVKTIGSALQTMKTHQSIEFNKQIGLELRSLVSYNTKWDARTGDPVEEENLSDEGDYYIKVIASEQRLSLLINVNI